MQQIKNSGGGGNLELIPQGFRGCHSEGAYPKESSQLLKIKAGLLRQKSRNDRFGFTLAEVLITLGIVGVVAALTIPAIVQNYKKQEVETSLKKIYTTVNQAIQKAEIDYGDYHTWVFSSNAEGVLETYFIPYLNVANVAVSYGGASAKCTIRRMYLTDGSLLIGNACNHAGYWIDFCYYPRAENWKGQYQSRGCLREDSGRSAFYFMFRINNPGPGNVNFTNSPFKPYVGGDVKGIINAESLTDPKYVYACNKVSSSPHQCTALIMYNNWKIPKDYPFRLK